MRTTARERVPLTLQSPFVCFRCRTRVRFNDTQLAQLSTRQNTSSRSQSTAVLKRNIQAKATARAATDTQYDSHSLAPSSHHSSKIKVASRSYAYGHLKQEQEPVRIRVARAHRDECHGGYLPITLRGRSAGTPFYRTRSESIQRFADGHVDTGHLRGFHTCVRHSLETTSYRIDDSVDTLQAKAPHTDPVGGIRNRLRQWQLERPRIDATLEPIHSSDGLNVSPTTENDEDISDQQVENNLLDIDMGDATLSKMAKLQTGDLIALEAGKNMPILAIYVRRLEDKWHQCYTIQGRRKHFFEKSVLWYSPAWVAPALVQPLLRYMPEENDREALYAATFSDDDIGVPRQAGLPLINEMTAFQEQSTEIYRKNALALDNAHEYLSHGSDLRYGSLSSVTMHLLQMQRSQVTPAALYAVRRALHIDRLGFSFHGRSQRSTGFLQIRSKAQTTMLRQVNKWVRQWQDEVTVRATSSQTPTQVKGIIPDFIAMARRVVLKSRETRKPTDPQWISSSKVVRKLSPEQDAVKIINGEAFTAEAQKLVSCFEYVACSKIFETSDDFVSTYCMVLKATGLYDDLPQVDMSVLFTFLQELGVLSPYENRWLYAEHLMLPSSRHSLPLARLAKSLAEESKQGFDFKDSMADLRHDWADLPVYCIDGANAKEIDDGISIEPDTTGNGWWVRMHIANPTAFLDKDLPIARMARHMGETFYSPDRTTMMMPAQATQHYWSLAPGRPTLTFSARLDQAGHIVEMDIRPGVVHNVKRFSPQTVDRLLGTSSSSSDQIVLVVGADVPDVEGNSQESQHTQQDKEILGKLTEVGKLLTAKRVANDGIVFNTPRNDAEVWTSWSKSGIGFTPLGLTHSRRFEGDPVIRTTFKKWKNPFGKTHVPDASALVQEYMLLTAEIAARWCSERQVPALYRGSFNAGRKPMSKDQFWTNVCEPAMRKNNGELPAHLGVEMLGYRGRSGAMTEPFKHQVLGLDYYTKVTSPLRRYGDMITHWQIEAALKHEARTDKSLITADKKADRSFLPFSKQALDTMAVGYLFREDIILNGKNKSLDFWQDMLLYRAHHCHELKLPFKTFTVWIGDASQPFADLHLGTITDLNVRCEMLARPLGSGMTTGLEVRSGDVWECELNHVKPYWAMIIVNPIKLLHRWE